MATTAGAPDRMGSPLSVGFVPRFPALTATLDARRAMVADVLHHGIDHLGVVDHVSFQGGQGYDGLIHASSLLSLDPKLHVYVGLYLLPLRHPLPVARQLATLAELAPGRLTFAVGIGGEDRAEVANCGVDPRVRGRRMDECLLVLRQLLRGETVTFAGDHITLDAAAIKPAPMPAIPIIVGGRSDAAHHRAARFGDGWLGIWVSPGRYGEAVARIEAEATELGRHDITWNHGLTVWAGLGETAEEGRAHLGPAMEATYRMPFTTFERWSPCGSPAAVADFLAPYVEAGCSTLNLIPRGRDLAAEIDGVAEIRRRLGVSPT